MASKPDLSEFFEKPKRLCIAHQLIEKLDAEDREKVLAALDESSIDAVSIVRFINKRGIDAKHPALLRHRKKECICYGIQKN
jgi:hypothetical protein